MNTTTPSKTTLIIALLHLSLLAGYGQSFRGLGDLPGSAYFSQANGVSADGRVVVGYSISNRYGDYSMEAFRWEDGQMTGLGALEFEGSSKRSFAMGASADGSVVVGYTTHSSEYSGRSFRWENGVMTALDVSLGTSGHMAFDVNADGSVIVGRANNYRTGSGELFRYTGYRWQQGTTTELATGQQFAIARGVSADGSVISLTGSPHDIGNNQPYRWDSGAMQSLPMPAGYSRTSTVNRVSANGEFIVGSLSGSSGSLAVRWNRTGGLLELTEGGASDISADGKVVVGAYSHPNDSAFIWIENKGLRNLRELLVESGISLGGWKLHSANAISDDGRVIVGTGINPQGHSEAWRAELPEVVLSISTPELGYQPGDTFVATVTVTSFMPKRVTVTFAEPLLGEEPSSGNADDAILKIAETELPGPFELTAENPERSFDVLVQVDKRGVTKLASSLSYTTADGRTAEISAKEEISIPPLEVKLKAKPLIGGKPIVNMLLDEEGKVTDADGNRISPKVEVTIENKSAQPVVASILGVDPRARDRSATRGRINLTGKFPILLETLAPGDIVTREFDLEVREDGRFEFIAVLTGRFDGTEVGFTARGRGAPIAVGEPYPVELEINYVPSSAITGINNGAFLVKPGSSLGIVASVKNLTSNSSLEFYGIEAKKEFNALNAILTSEIGNTFNPPFPHNYAKTPFGNQVDPNGTRVLSGKVETEAEGAASGVVTWLGPEDAFLVDDATRVRTKVEPDDVLVTGDAGGWLGNELSLRVIQDRRSPMPDQDVAWYERIGPFGKDSLIAMGKWWHDSLDAIGGIGRLGGAVYENPSLLADAYGVGSRAVWEGAEMLAVTWRGMSEEEKKEFVGSLVSEVQQRAVLLATTRQPFTPDDYEAAAQFVNNAVYAQCGGIEAAYASNDPRKITEVWAQVTTNIAMEAATAAFPTPKFTSYMKGVDAAKLAKNDALAESLTIQEDFLRAVSGPVPVAAVQKHWGAGGKNLADIQELFRYFKIKGYMRERSPSAFRLIDELDEAVWKPEPMKPKGLQWTEGNNGELPGLDNLLLDGKFPTVLGKDGKSVLPPNGITPIFMPEADDIIKARLQAQGHSEEIIAAVLGRAKDRRAEFEEYAPLFREWARPLDKGGGIPVKKNYKDNGVPDPGEPGPPRGFRFQEHEVPGEPIIYIPQMANVAGEFRYISGDIDWVHFSFLNGMPLDARTARLFYDAMWRLGLQHPETISWIKEGQTVFAGKINQIAGFLRGEKALLEVSGDSLRAVHINQNLTRFANDGRNHLIFFDEGLKSRAKATAADVETAFYYMQQKFPDRRLLAPFLWFGKSSDMESDEGGAMRRPGNGASTRKASRVNGSEWSFTTADNAILARQGNGSTTIEVFNGANWISTNFADVPKPLALTPTTALSVDVAAGETVLPVVDLPALWPDEMAGHVSNWFAVGQAIVIAPGETTQEVRRIVAPGLVVDRPLEHYHREGTLVAVIPHALAEIFGVTPVPPRKQLLNIATRLNVRTGENVLIGGLIVTGAEPKRVIIRAIGPSLSEVFPGVLSDPVVELYEGDTLLASNDNWRDTQQAEIEETTIPPSHELESAIVYTLPPGSYTAVMSGKGGATGIGVVEVYDLDQAADSRLANIASRGFVEAGDNVMIGGLIVGGSGTQDARILVRAIGASLANAGVEEALQDPTLELRDTNGELVSENDNWQDTQPFEIEATTIPPGDPAEAAILAQLPSGNYTAIVRGKNDSTGVGLVEVYNLP